MISEIFGQREQHARPEIDYTRMKLEITYRWDLYSFPYTSRCSVVNTMNKLYDFSSLVFFLYFVKTVRLAQRSSCDCSLPPCRLGTVDCNGEKKIRKQTYKIYQKEKKNNITNVALQSCRISLDYLDFVEGFKALSYINCSNTIKANLEWAKGESSANHHDLARTEISFSCGCKVMQ